MKTKLKLLTAICALAAAFSASAQTYPSKPVRLVVGFSGGVTDVVNRLVAEEVGKKLGQPVVVESRTGASGLVAASAVKTAAPDGYTLFGGAVAQLHPILVKNALDASKELTPVGNLVNSEWFLYSPGNINVGGLKELAAYAKTRQQKIRLSSLSPRNTMLFAVVAKRLGMEFEDIPYKTTDQVIAALLNGDGAVTVNAASGFDAHLQSGKLKAIATLSPVRSAVRPNVPTAREQGVDAATVTAIGWWGPRGLPNDVVSKLNGALRDSLQVPALAEKARNAGVVPAAGTPEQLLKDLEDELAFMKEAIGLIGYTPQ